ncbi:MAG: hypothetical protein ACTHKQ_18085 [Mesorhizobium sp.]
MTVAKNGYKASGAARSRGRAIQGRIRREVSFKKAGVQSAKRLKERPWRSSMKSLGLPPVSKLRVQGGVIKCLEEVEVDMRQLGRRYHESLRRQIAKVYALAFVLRDDQDQWLEFCRHPFWDKRGPRDKDQPIALQFALKLACGKGRLAQQKASKYWKALDVWFEQNIPASEIPDLVKRGGGWQKCADSNAASKKKQETEDSVGSQTEDALGSHFDSDESSSSEDSPEAKRLPTVSVKFSSKITKKLATAQPKSRLKIVVEIVTVSEKRITARARSLIF